MEGEYHSDRSIMNKLEKTTSSQIQPILETGIPFSAWQLVILLSLDKKLKFDTKE